MMIDDRRSAAHFDIILAVLVFSLAAFGVLCVAVATYSTNSTEQSTVFNYIVSSTYSLRQTLFFFASFIIIGFLCAIPTEFLRRHAQKFYYLAIGLLLITLTSQVAGVKAWINIIWGYTIQPSEFIKLAMILLYAKILARTDQPMRDMKSFILEASVLLIPAAICLAEGEMGSVLVMIFIFGVMLFFGGVELKTLFTIVGVAVLALLVLVGIATAVGSDSYRLTRILSFLDPSAASSDSTLQVDRSKIAIGSGGFSGIGMFVNGSWSQLNYVPEDWTDFIYASIGEAFGFVGCFGIILMYLAIILRMMYLARFTKDKYGQLVIIGVMAMMLFHIFENIAMTVGLMPVTGIPLPFLSYGGSNMVTNMGGIGMVLNVTRNRSLAPKVTAPQIYIHKYGANLKTIREKKEK